MFEIIVHPLGDLVDFHAWDEFAETLARVLETSGGPIILDLQAVNRMSSNYIGTIIGTYKVAEEKGKQLKLINVQPKLYALFEMLKLTEMISMEKA